MLLTHPERRDKKTAEYTPQGYLEVSVEVIPQEEADKLANGFGQENPNMFPVLPAPTGRFKFDLFSPWKMLKEMFGPTLARRILCVGCCIICCLLILFVFYIYGAQIGLAILF